MQFLIYQFESISKLAKLTPSHLHLYMERLYE